MASVFKLELQELQSELVGLIESGALNARLDSHKVLFLTEIEN